MSEPIPLAHAADIAESVGVRMHTPRDRFEIESIDFGCAVQHVHLHATDISHLLGERTMNPFPPVHITAVHGCLSQISTFLEKVNIDFRYTVSYETTDINTIYGVRMTFAYPEQPIEEEVVYFPTEDDLKCPEHFTENIRIQAYYFAQRMMTLHPSSSHG